jgi:hypothetical protein
MLRSPSRPSKKRKSGLINFVTSSGYEWPIWLSITHPLFNSTSVLLAPAATSQAHIGFPGHAREALLCRRSDFFHRMPRASTRAATHSFSAQTLLQRLCHVAENP